MDLNNLILFFFLVIFGSFFYKYFLLFLNKFNSNFFIDNEFKKPQAFHEVSIPTYGGMGIFFSLLLHSDCKYNLQSLGHPSLC